MSVEALDTFKDVLGQRDVRIAIQHEFRLGHSAAATATNVNGTSAISRTFCSTTDNLPSFDGDGHGEKFSCVMELDPLGKRSRNWDMSFSRTQIILQNLLRLIITCFANWTVCTLFFNKLFSNQDALIQGVRDFFDQCGADFFQRGIFSLKPHWAKCVSADGGYFTE